MPLVGDDRITDGVNRFFAYARERHQVYLNKTAGKPWPWTGDEILQTFSFTNVFRELDKTTVWFREKVRGPLADSWVVLLATVVFRMLNRIEVGEAMFCQTTLDHSLPSGSVFGGKNVTAFDQFYHDGDARHLRRAIKQFCGSGPYVTGAYIITSPTGYSKLDGMMRVLQGFYKNSDWRGWAQTMKEHADSDRYATFTLQKVWEWLTEQPYLGTFHSYEIVTDLRHTSLLDTAPDVDVWCNVGPGARRGLNRVMGRDKRDKTVSVDAQLREMKKLLVLARQRHGNRWWPQRHEWPQWEMREVEHTLCEFDKYERVRLGEGRPRGVYRHS